MHARLCQIIMCLLFVVQIRKGDAYADALYACARSLLLRLSFTIVIQTKARDRSLWIKLASYGSRNVFFYGAGAFRPWNRFTANDTSAAALHFVDI